MKKVSPYCWLALLLAACFTLATLFVPRAEWWDSAPDAANWNGNSESENAFKLLLGDGRKLFANEFFVMGDVYFHSGYYPSIFDRHESELDVAAPAHGTADDSNSTEDDFLGPPKKWDWIAILGRNFVPNRHTHLDAGGASGNMKPSSVQEILPWLKLAAEMDPQMTETYTVGAYWLRTSLHQPREAEAFLREGLRNNPDSYQILFELGRLYHENYHDTDRARNLWLLALKKWAAQSSALQKENKLAFEEITVNLGNLERENGHYAQAIHWLEGAKKVSPAPAALQKQIDDLKKKLAAQTGEAH